MGCCGQPPNGYVKVWRIRGVNNPDGSPADFSSQRAAEDARPAGNRQPAIQVTKLAPR